MDSADGLALVTKIESLMASVDQLGATIAKQGIGVSEKLDNASAKIAEAVDKASAASQSVIQIGLRLPRGRWSLRRSSLLSLLPSTPIFPRFTAKVRT